MADDSIACGSVTIPRSELSVRFSRSSGPGGQGVNTTDSRVQLTFDLAGSPSVPERLRERALRRLSAKLVDGCLVVSASEQRAQLQNRRAAEQRLAEMLAAAFAPPPRPRRPTRPTKGSTERRIKEKKGRAVTKRLRGSASHDSD
ncbi:MAG: aminoacyl-tRNA hydrolase [Actinobacteria bacterium]|uniref:Unannotated protein n=1 Tax=freshwater metagenome TaxID=449393 RepID=A0A6J7EUT1_9ZZZZ|nr:aminoacyl-tRNA hydrolase [Actinomycetota bacterium]